MKKQKSVITSAGTDLNPLELVEVIYRSGVPEAKKLAYLFAIANGTFSGDHFEALLADLNVTGFDLEKGKKQSTKKIDVLQNKQEKLQKSLLDLQIKAAEEMETNIDKLLNVLEKEVEADRETQKAKKAHHLKTTLRKQK